MQITITKEHLSTALRMGELNELLASPVEALLTGLGAQLEQIGGLTPLSVPVAAGHVSAEDMAAYVELYAMSRNWQPRWTEEELARAVGVLSQWAAALNEGKPVILIALSSGEIEARTGGVNAPVRRTPATDVMLALVGLGVCTPAVQEQIRQRLALELQPAQFQATGR